MAEATQSKDAAAHITPKEAVQAAAKHFKDITGYAGEVSVEEMEWNADEEAWSVTLGYLERALAMPTVPATPFPKKAYKAFEIDGRSGQVRKMRIREI